VAAKSFPSNQGQGFLEILLPEIKNQKEVVSDRISVSAKRFPNEPTKPFVKTSFPGPETQSYIEQYGKSSCEKQILFPVDLHNSLGNYVADADGNQFLDVMTSVACIGMGYNHPAILEVTKSPTFKRLLATRTGVGCAPPKEQRQLVQSAFLDIAPQGLDRVAGAMCGTCSIETAFKHAFICHA